MVERNIDKVKTIKEPGDIFATAIASDYVEMSNVGYVDFVINTGVGTAANTTIKVKAKLGEDGEAEAIPFRIKSLTAEEFDEVTADGKAFSIGGTATKCGACIVRVGSDSLKGEYDRVSINTTAVSQSAVPGSIIAILHEPRYSK